MNGSSLDFEKPVLALEAQLEELRLLAREDRASGDAVRLFRSPTPFPTLMIALAEIALLIAPASSPDRVSARQLTAVVAAVAVPAITG